MPAFSLADTAEDGVANPWKRQRVRFAIPDTPLPCPCSSLRHLRPLREEEKACTANEDGTPSDG